ncbi:MULTISPECIES: LysR family transcriptional regulator [Caproicibacterium]|uniref:LysR family transcriptional regulator n=1 Tax=Caproicibacterium argilliputei TaxID=3030016 RepID=A0AA97DC41_9FIRM|nr:LysR family transcriptional regulator [Caproicibacterium argilliputei]WOC32858.1 LysR family transcriptional regulator [Caproicibacterium argilliputei]
MLDYRMETFFTVCQTMNFTHAAQRLHLTQPAVSHQIQQLEELYQVKLFENHGKKLTLTPAGRALQSAAVTMRHDSLLLAQQLRQIDGGARQMIFGATLTAGPYAILPPLLRYLQANPQLNLRLVIADTTDLLTQIEQGKIDFAVVEGFFPKKEYEAIPYARETFVAVCAQDYVFHRSVETVEDLLEERLLVREKGSGTRSILETYLHSRNLMLEDFPHWAEVNSILMLKQMACAGCGVTFLYETAVQEELQNGLLRRVPLRDFSLAHDFSFVWRRGSVFSAHYRQIFEDFCALR